MSAEVLVFTGILSLLLYIVIKSAFKLVPDGYEYTVERFGRYRSTLTPGLKILIPGIDKVGQKINMMEQITKAPSQVITTKDKALVTVEAVVFYQVIDAARASTKMKNLDDVILNQLTNELETVISIMDLDELLLKRDEINARVLSVVDEAINSWGVNATRIEIFDVTPISDDRNISKGEKK